MSVSVALSYKCAVYFLIKNVHYILDSVKVADGRPPSALPRLIIMICYVLFVKDLCCFACFFKFVISASIS